MAAAERHAIVGEQQRFLDAGQQVLEHLRVGSPVLRRVGSRNRAVFGVEELLARQASPAGLLERASICRAASVAVAMSGR